MLKTRSGLPKHCTYQPDRSGKRRVRFRRHGVSIYLTGIPWSEDFMRQYAAALEVDQQQRAQVGAARTLPGSFDELFVAYAEALKRSHHLQPSTIAERLGILQRFRPEHGHRSVKDLQRVHVERIVAKKAETVGIESANNLLKALRIILDFAIGRGFITANPAHGVKRFKSKNEDGHHSWDEDEIRRYEMKHPLDTRAGLALALLVYTGQRRGDVLRLGWQHVRGDRIVIRQQKTGIEVTLPIHPQLALALAALPRTTLTFLVTKWGAPFSLGGFNHWFGRKCREAGLPPNCTPHGLRKAAGRRLSEAGCSEKEIAAFLGHESLREVQRYTKAADRKWLAGQAMERQLRSESEQNLPKTSTHVYPTAKQR
jgi:integrase